MLTKHKEIAGQCFFRNVIVSDVQNFKRWEGAEASRQSVKTVHSTSKKKKKNMNNGNEVNTEERQLTNFKGVGWMVNAPQNLNTSIMLKLSNFNKLGRVIPSIPLTL